jgi:protein-S-isoprenylcysteine O-methyltransferase Ste14
MFILGISVFILGLAGFITALFNFKNASVDRPVTEGLYQLSRHPQQLMFFLTVIGICLAIGSWLALLFQTISSVFLHARILAEEQACLARYGDSYRDYMQRVPRYFLFF